MTINNPDEFMDSLWDWAILDGCFGKTRIKPTDMDGLVERNGKFLGLETKKPDVEIPMGQRITFENLIKSGNWTIIVAWGFRNEPQKLMLMTSKTTRIYEDADINTFRNIVSQWFEYANSTQPPKFSE